MTTILHIDSSARSGISGEDAYGSHTRRLSARFVRRWQQARPDSRIVYRDVGQNPPKIPARSARTSRWRRRKAPWRVWQMNGWRKRPARIAG